MCNVFAPDPKHAEEARFVAFLMAMADSRLFSSTEALRVTISQAYADACEQYWTWDIEKCLKSRLARADRIVTANSKSIALRGVGAAPDVKSRASSC